MTWYAIIDSIRSDKMLEGCHLDCPVSVSFFPSFRQRNRQYLSWIQPTHIHTYIQAWCELWFSRGCGVRGREGGNEYTFLLSAKLFKKSVNSDLRSL